MGGMRRSPRVWQLQESHMEGHVLEAIQELDQDASLKELEEVSQLLAKVKDSA